MADLAVDRQELLVGESTAVFSADRVYRYALTRTWTDGPLAVFLMLNPSKADAFRLDPTVTRCIGFARAWSCGGLVVLNAFGLRSTDPRALDGHPDPVGPDNDEVIRRHLATAAGGPVVAAWGADRSIRVHGRDAVLCGHVRAVTGQAPACLGTTKTGAPRHPLYVRGDVRPTAWAA
jgi:hypothetical protein